MERSCEERFYVPNCSWIEKCIQLYNVLAINNGVVVIGEPGTGKSGIINALFSAIQLKEGKIGKISWFDAKTIKKENLYGFLNPTTREWTDGVLTTSLRKEYSDEYFHWIVFDGDVDPEWVENLNSLLDDNKVLTLPHGERIQLQRNTRILFEVSNLKYATPATVSRCGIVSFPAGIITPTMVCKRFCKMLCTVPVNEIPKVHDYVHSNYTFSVVPPLQPMVAKCLESIFESGTIESFLETASEMAPILTCFNIQHIENVCTLIVGCVKELIEYQYERDDLILTEDIISMHLKESVAQFLLWSVASSLNESDRETLGVSISNSFGILYNRKVVNLFDYHRSLEHDGIIPWSESVPKIYMDQSNVEAQNIVVPTVDTIRNEKMFYSWLSERRPLILCGPPGSGKVSIHLLDHDFAFIIAKTAKYRDTIHEFLK